MTLLDPRFIYSPFEYQKAYDYFLQQNMAHWLHTEINMKNDLNDWKLKLTDSERNVIGKILKGFTQTELIVEDYWSTKISGYFPKPEVKLMTSAFANMEAIHAVSYAYLNESLGLNDFSAFLQEPTAKARIDRLLNTKENSKEDIARNLAIFSGMTEGVALFSQFAVLMNFSRFNKMKGVGNIITFSIRDESLHSEAGCWLFRTFISEYPELWTDKLKKEIYDAARLTVQLEDAFIDNCFEAGEVEGLTKEELKNYIRYRTNTKLQDLNLKTNWKNINKDLLDKMMWFDILSNGTEHTDFFASRVSTYFKGSLNWDNIFETE